MTPLGPLSDNLFDAWNLLSKAGKARPTPAAHSFEEHGNVIGTRSRSRRRPEGYSGSADTWGACIEDYMPPLIWNWLVCELRGSTSLFHVLSELPRYLLPVTNFPSLRTGDRKLPREQPQFKYRFPSSTWRKSKLIRN